MPYPDEADYDDRDRDRDERDTDDRGGDPRRGQGRPSRAARPAWDAGTYGARDDLRRPAAFPGPPPDRYGSPPQPPEPLPRPPEPFAAPPYFGDRYAPEPYPADPYPPDPYPVERPVSFSAGRPPPASFGGPASFGPATPTSFAPPAYEAPWSADDGDDSERDQRRSDRQPAGAFPGGADPVRTEEPRAPRAGRNLPAAIGVGVGLGGLAAGSLIFWRPAFLGLLAVVVGIGIWELVRAIRNSGANPPMIPLIAGGALMTGLAWWGQGAALTFGLLVTVLAAMVWRLADGAAGYGRDVTSATLIAVYLPFLAGFAAMLASAPDGDRRVVVTLAGVVLSDTGGYIAGVIFGKHPMAPSVSPKKSWEGLGGSLLATAIGGALLLHFVFHVHWYWGLVFGLAVSMAAVVGDLGESMIKRDLGVKDMSNLLPGHGGFMDRLDSILFAAPTAYALLALLAPIG